MKILFISRAYPPVQGGIENQNYALSLWLSRHATVRTIANRGGKAMLPFFLPRVLIQSLFLLPRYDIVLLGDGVLAPLGYIQKIFFPKKIVASVIHGLDITFATKPGFLARVYAAINIPCLKKLDLLIAVSRETASIAEQTGIAKEQLTVINNGIDPETLRGEYSRQELETFLGEDLAGKHVIVRTGRYVKHKGVEWFVKNVVPRLPDNTLFVAAGAIVKKNTPGDVDVFPACQKAVSDLGLGKRVKLFTNLPWEKMRLLFNTADIIVSPNIVVPGTMEGFGISVLEAALCGRPVIASDLEGLKDAICHNENGILVEPENPEAFVRAILPLLESADMRHALGERAARYTETHFHWNIIARLYIETLARLIEKTR